MTAGALAAINFNKTVSALVSVKFFGLARQSIGTLAKRINIYIYVYKLDKSQRHSNPIL